MTELELQRELVAAAVADGAQAFKANNRFLVGIPDLFAQYPGWPALWIEVKFTRDLPVSKFARLALTPKQRLFIMTNQRAGGRSGWILAAQIDRRGNYALALGADHEASRVYLGLDDDRVVRRDRGQPWPMREICERLLTATSPTAS